MSDTAGELHAEVLPAAQREVLARIGPGVDEPLLDPLRSAPGYGCRLASLRDVAAMKLAAITQRGARKDLHDVVALGRAGLGLGEMLDAYRRKFSVDDVGHVLVALTWFDDADKDPEPVLAARESWTEVKDTLRDWVRELARG